MDRQCAAAISLILASAGATAVSAGAHCGDLFGDSLGAAVDRYCVDCHSGPHAKAQLDLSSIPRSQPVRVAMLRAVRDRLRRGDMPPEGEERPDAVMYGSLVEAINVTIDNVAARAEPGRPTLRRLNRVEFRNTMRDLLGVEVDVTSVLPNDDVGEGFDHIGEVLSMAPTLLEKYLDIAERVAIRAWPDAVEAKETVAHGGQLVVRAGGRTMEREAVVWSSGEASAQFDAPRDGRYRIRFRAFGDQAGPEIVKVAVKVGKERVAYFDISETRAAPGGRACEATISAGHRQIAVEFLNDFYNEELPEGKRDRNLHVIEIALDGPVDTVAPTREAAAMGGTGGDVDRFVGGLLDRAFRRPSSAEERSEFVARIRASLPDDAAWPLVARTAIVAVLVDPRFLFRVESDPAPGDSSRALDGYELASRLSYACWSSMPDETLTTAAAQGELENETGVRRSLARLLDDPRSLAVAENFGQQWLLVRSVDEKQPDPQRFHGVDAALLRDMKAETTLFMDRMLRERRPLRELLAADWTFLNARLAAHYGIDGIDGDWLRLVRVGDRRMPGLLGHGSVLVATSNPTRTSPVKRGKWILDALLDAPPPPPPPGVPVLPEKSAAPEGASMRDLLALHRSDPSCAACHRRMDAFGLALETLDAVGRERSSDDGVSIDSSTELPDGRIIDGPRMLAAMLADDPAVTRSVVRHLFVYVLGRGLSDDDEATVDRIARGFSPESSLRDVFEAIVLSDQFRRRGAPPKEPS